MLPRGQQDVLGGHRPISAVHGRTLQRRQESTILELSPPLGQQVWRVAVSLLPGMTSSPIVESKRGMRDPIASHRGLPSGGPSSSGAEK